jgi:hypothetical protein
MFVASGSLLAWVLRPRGAILAVDRESAELRSSRSERLKSGSPQVTFNLTNNGNEPLRIYQVDPGCGCLSLAEPKSPIAPRESWPLTIQVNTGAAGRRDVVVRIYSNCTQNPVKSLAVGIEFEPEAPYVIRTIPDVVFREEPGLAREQKLNVQTIEQAGTARWIETMRLVGAPFAELSEIDFSEKPHGNSAFVERTYSFLVRRAGPIPDGEHRGVIHLLTAADELRKPEIIRTIGVYGSKRPPIVVAPRTVFVRRSSDGGFAPARVIVAASDQNAVLSITSVTSPYRWLRATLANSNLGGTRQTLHVEIDRDKYDGTREAEVLLQTSSPTQEQIAIPIRITDS